MNQDFAVSGDKSTNVSSSKSDTNVSVCDKVNQSDVSAFERVMDQKKDKGNEQGKSKKDDKDKGLPIGELFQKDKKDKQYESMPVEADSQLNGAFGILAQQHIGQSLKIESAALDSKAVVNKIANEVIEKIIVSNSVLEAKQEVRINFKNDVLPGTEALISKDGNSIKVTFVTNVESSQKLILQNRDDLKYALNEKINNADVVVDVNKSYQSNSDTGNGRSRNQYFSDDQNEDDNQNKL